MGNATKSCRMCDNAATNPELNSDNDLSFSGIGECVDGYRIMLRSGDGRPTGIIFERWNEKAGWSTIGHYLPKYCPNCGRELKENERFKIDAPVT